MAVLPVKEYVKAEGALINVVRRVCPYLILPVGVGHWYGAAVPSNERTRSGNVPLVYTVVTCQLAELKTSDYVRKEITHESASKRETRLRTKLSCERFKLQSKGLVETRT